MLSVATHGGQVSLRERTVEVHRRVVGHLVVDQDLDLLALFDLERRCREGAVDQNHISFDAIGRPFSPCERELELLALGAYVGEGGRERRESQGQPEPATSCKGYHGC